tara:strand:+ start:229 stop:411 length:183 start_codon:yes stop_codon:yes gene_type:complete
MHASVLQLTNNSLAGKSTILHLLIPIQMAQIARKFFAIYLIKFKKLDSSNYLKFNDLRFY